MDFDTSPYLQTEPEADYTILWLIVFVVILLYFFQCDQPEVGEHVEDYVEDYVRRLEARQEKNRCG